jgi:hypothetical protein
VQPNLRDQYPSFPQTVASGSYPTICDTLELKEVQTSSLVSPLTLPFHAPLPPCSPHSAHSRLPRFTQALKSTHLAAHCNGVAFNSPPTGSTSASHSSNKNLQTATWLLIAAQWRGVTSCESRELIVSLLSWPVCFSCFRAGRLPD